MADIAVTPGMSDELKRELAEITNVQRAAVLMLLLGEDLASNIISYLDPKEVQELGAAMVSVADMSQEAVNVVLDQFVDMLKRQTSLSLGTTEYVETVLKRALGPDKAASVLARIMPNRASRGLEILQWMDARAIAEAELAHPAGELRRAGERGGQRAVRVGEGGELHEHRAGDVPRLELRAAVAWRLAGEVGMKAGIGDAQVARAEFGGEPFGGDEGVHARRHSVFVPPRHAAAASLFARP